MSVTDPIAHAVQHLQRRAQFARTTLTKPSHALTSAAAGIGKVKTAPAAITFEGDASGRGGALKGESLPDKKPFSFATSQVVGIYWGNFSALHANTGQLTVTPVADSRRYADEGVAAKVKLVAQGKGSSAAASGYVCIDLQAPSPAARDAWALALWKVVAVERPQVQLQRVLFNEAAGPADTAAADTATPAAATSAANPAAAAPAPATPDQRQQPGAAASKSELNDV